MPPGRHLSAIVVVVIEPSQRVGKASAEVRASSLQSSEAVSTSVNDAEVIALRVGEDDVVGIGGAIGLGRTRSTERKQSLDVASLVLGIEVKVYPWALLGAGWFCA